LRFRGLHHIQIPIPVGGESKARGFFGGILGLGEIPKPPNLAVRGGLWFQVGAHELHLGIEPEFRPQWKVHPAFEVEDLDTVRQRLHEQHQVTWDDLPLAGYRRFYARDPFGNRLEFLERDQGPEQTENDL
jgi:catechol 2,3-dioxygenase-like lactoylglutathione lyase family enzyme